jgi:hypothetical protein
MPREIYEACFSGSCHPEHPEILDHMFQVEFQDAQTRVALRRARFYVRGDDRTQAFLAAHPQWRLGCWPFGLFVLKDWMWHVKFIDVPERCRVLESGVDDPKIGRSYIRAELEIFENHDGWMLPLFNLANTHVLDQLSAFYQQNPTATPRQERIELVMSEERTRQEKALQEHRREQQERASLVPAQSGRSWVFIDESGDPGVKNLHSVYVFSAVLVPDAVAETVRAELRAVLRRWPQNAPAEIHMTAAPEALRPAVMDDLAKVIIRHNLRVVVFVVHKWYLVKNLLRRHAEARRADDNPLTLPWEEYLKNPAYRFRFNFLSVMIQEVVSHLSLDFTLRGYAGDFRHDRKHVPWMNDALRHGFTTGLQLAAHDADVIFGKNLVPASTFDIADSHAEPCLWLSDWISWEMRNWSVSAVPDFSPSFRSTIPNMLFVSYDENGVKVVGREPGGHADNSLPDFPREFPMDDTATPPTET